MRFSANLASLFLLSLLAIRISADSSSSTLSSNNTDASDGDLTVEEQYGDNATSTGTKGTTGATGTTGSSGSSGVTGSTTLPTTSGVKTTTPKSGKPRAPSFAGWSFFIGIIVAFLIIGIAVFLFKFFCQRRGTTGNNVPYTPYQG